MIEQPTHWHADREGLKIYKGGELVAVIPFSRLGQLVFDLTQAMLRR